MDRTLHTDQDLIELWLGDRPPNTRAAYAADARLLLEAVGRTFQEVAGVDLVRFAQALQGSPASRARRIASVRSLFAFGVRVGFLRQNPSTILQFPRATGSLHERILSEEEVVAVLAEAEPGRNRSLIRTLYLGGLRISEALGLRFKDLGAKWLNVVGKGSRARTVVVSKELVDELHVLRWRTDADDASVFKNEAGRPMSTSFARRIVRRASEEAIGRAISPHHLRHSHATHALERGAPIHLVQNSLGHRSVATTSAYLHVRPGQGSSQYLAVPPL